MEDNLDVGAVGIPVTGLLALAPFGTALPTPAEGKDPELKLPAAWFGLGLLTKEGGPEWTLEADGEKIDFWQDGFSIPSGIAKASLKVTLAQTDEVVRRVIRGKVADEHGFITFDAAGSGEKWVLWSEEIFKNRTIRRRVAGNVSIATVKEQKSARGEVTAVEVEFTIDRSPELNGEHIGEWLLPAGVAPVVAVPTVTGATPTGAVAGALVTITGTGFTAVDSVKFGSSNSTLFVAESATSLQAVMPPGTAGSAAITVRNSAGVSNSFAFTRG